MKVIIKTFIYRSIMVSPVVLLMMWLGFSFSAICIAASITGLIVGAVEGWEEANGE